jgi:protein-disulfide isomerase
MKAISLLLVLSVGLLRASCEKKGDADDVTKEQPILTLDGVDTSALTPREKREWSGYVAKLDAPCAGSGTVASCISGKKSCEACVPAAKYLLKSVRDGMTNEQIEKAYQNRFETSKMREVRIEGSPSKGPENASTTVVEFADFECPHCAMMEPAMNKAFAQFGGDARFVFKFMPLGKHAHGDISARAGIAAMRQGKFWEMHDKMFKNQAHLEETNLLDYAKELGLDVAAFKVDMNGPEAADRLAKDKKLADDLVVGGTPTIYINGRLFQANANPEQALTDWITLDLTLKGLTAKPAPALLPAPGPGPGPGPVAAGSASVAKDAGAPTAKDAGSPMPPPKDAGK